MFPLKKRLPLKALKEVGAYSVNYFHQLDLSGSNFKWK